MLAIMSKGTEQSSYALNRFFLSVFYTVGLSFTNVSYWGMKIYAFLCFTVIATLSALLYDRFLKCKPNDQINQTVVVPESNI